MSVDIHEKGNLHDTVNMPVKVNMTLPEMPKDWKVYNAERMAELDPHKRACAVQFLKGFYLDNPPVVRMIRRCAKKDPQTWWAPYHLGWGMAIRNLLRENGYGEKELGIGNLDDYYIGLVEAALL